MLRTLSFMLGKVSKYKEKKSKYKKNAKREKKKEKTKWKIKIVCVFWQSVQELPEEAAQRQGLRAPTYKCPKALDGCRVLTGERQGQQHFQEGCQIGLGLPEPGALRHL